MTDTRWTTRWIYTALAVSLAACGSPRPDGHEPPPADQEPSPVDAATPARYRTAGDPCGSTADCADLRDSQCLPWPGGYCTSACDPDGTCAEGICADTAPPGFASLGLLCLRECERDRECRPGYRCTWTLDGQVCTAIGPW